MFVLSGGNIVVPVIDVGKVTVKGDGLQRAAVNCPTTFRVSTKASGEANLDVVVTGDSTNSSRTRNTFYGTFICPMLYIVFHTPLSKYLSIIVMTLN